MAPRVLKAPSIFNTTEADQVLVLIDAGELSEDDIADHWKKERSRALGRGVTVLDGNGDRVWRETQPIADHTKPGSAAYPWHADGDRIRAERVEITFHPDGTKERRVLRRVWSTW